MTLDKFGIHINQQKKLGKEIHSLMSTIIEDTVKKMYYNVIITFQSNTFLNSEKSYLLDNVKMCHVFSYERAIIEHVVGYPADIIVIINENEFLLEKLVNLPLKRGDNISFREKDINTENTNLFVEFFMRIPIGLSNIIQV